MANHRPVHYKHLNPFKMTEASFYATLLSFSGTALVIILGMVGFFIRMAVKDIKENKTNIGRAHGKIDLLSQKQKTDREALEQMTQSEIKLLATEVRNLAKTVADYIKFDQESKPQTTRRKRS